MPIPKFNALALLSISTLALISCSSAPKTSAYPSNAVPSSEIGSLEQRFSVARQNQVDVLAPNAFKKANNALNDAKTENAKGDIKDSLEELAESRAWLEQSEESAKRVRADAPEILEARSQNIQLGANALAPKNWAEAEEEFRDLTSKNEKDKNSGIDADDRKEVLDLYILSHQESLRQKYLARSNEMIRVVEKDGGGKLIPNILGDAKKKVGDAEGIIVSSRNDEPKIAKSAQDAEAASKRAMDMLKKAQTAKGQSPEALAMALDREEQAGKGLATKLNSTQKGLQASEAALEASTTEGRALTGQVELQEKVNELQKKFSKDEAEVLQQGKTVTVRLKGLAFETNKGDIPSRSFPLMTSVKEVLREFPNSEITIEGHTDSRGSAAVNKRLSEERANAVKEYLMSGGDVGNANIVSSGHGFNNPIASNKAKDGRAKNRRVDVVIKNAIQ